MAFFRPVTRGIRRGEPSAGHNYPSSNLMALVRARKTPPATSPRRLRAPPPPPPQKHRPKVGVRRCIFPTRGPSPVAPKSHTEKLKVHGRGFLSIIERIARLPNRPPRQAHNITHPRTLHRWTRARLVVGGGADGFVLVL